MKLNLYLDRHGDATPAHLTERAIVVAGPEP